MNSRLQIESLRAEHLPELAQALCHPAVYQYLGEDVPSMADFTLGLMRAIAGPPPARHDQTWLNYLVRETHTERVIGQLQSTVIDGVAEVAFLFDPAVWGRGYAAEGLIWLHTEVRKVVGDVQFWATTVPANLRCQALLARCAYIEVPSQQAPPLASYDAGDLVFKLPVAQVLEATQFSL